MKHYTLTAFPGEREMEELRELAAQEEFEKRSQELRERVDLLEQEMDLIADFLGVKFTKDLRLEKVKK